MWRAPFPEQLLKLVSPRKRRGDEAGANTPATAPGPREALSFITTSGEPTTPQQLQMGAQFTEFVRAAVMSRLRPDSEPTHTQMVGIKHGEVAIFVRPSGTRAVTILAAENVGRASPVRHYLRLDGVNLLNALDGRCGAMTTGTRALRRPHGNGQGVLDLMDSDLSAPTVEAEVSTDPDEPDESAHMTLRVTRTGKGGSYVFSGRLPLESNPGGDFWQEGNAWALFEPQRPEPALICWGTGVFLRLEWMTTRCEEVVSYLEVDDALLAVAASTATELRRLGERKTVTLRKSETGWLPAREARSSHSN